MENRVQELLNRRPNRWGNVTIKTFEQDIKLLQDTVKKQQAEIERLKDICRRHGIAFE